MIPASHVAAVPSRKARSGVSNMSEFASTVSGDVIPWTAGAVSPTIPEASPEEDAQVRAAPDPAKRSRRASMAQILR